MSFRRGRNWTVTLMGVSLTACATIDVPTSPALPDVELVSSTFENTSLSGISNSTETVPDWWTRFDDPELVILVERALSENRDLAVAKANVAASDALLNRARLGQSHDLSSATNMELEHSLGSSNVDIDLNGALQATWEFDAFDRIEAQISAAAFNREALVQARRDVAVLVASQTAQAYVDLRNAQARLAVAQENTTLQAEGLDLINQLVDAGRSNELDLNRSRALYLTTRASLPTFRAAVATATARLNLLTGSYATLSDDVLSAAVAQHGDIPSHLGALTTGSPESLIRRRPDIRAAEARVSERLALGEVDRARLFPTLVFNADLSAFFGSVDNGPDTTFFGLGVGPAINWEGPDLRRVRADIDVTDAQILSAYANYEQTVFTALSEVDTALSLYSEELQRRDDLIGATDAASNALKLARLRFDEGMDDFLDVLDAQRTLLNAQDDLVQNNALITTFAISAYRALGGMWTEDELDAISLPAQIAETAMTPDALPVERLTP